jgi:hypothetical protein
MWFVIAAVAGISGAALLLFDRGWPGPGSLQGLGGSRGPRGRGRRQWAALRGWEFAAADPELPGQWRHGAMAHAGGSGTARNVVTGSLFTAAGRRVVHVFDQEMRGGSDAVLVAVHRRAPQPVVLELWLPTVDYPTDAGLDLLGPVGDRYAFTSDPVIGRALITPELVAMADDVGDDVPVVWIEYDWVVASLLAPGAGPTRLERLLRLLGDLADLVDGVHANADQRADPDERTDTDADHPPQPEDQPTPHDHQDERKP